MYELFGSWREALGSVAIFDRAFAHGLAESFSFRIAPSKASKAAFSSAMLSLPLFRLGSSPSAQSADG